MARRAAAALFCALVFALWQSTSGDDFTVEEDFLASTVNEGSFKSSWGQKGLHIDQGAYPEDSSKASFQSRLLSPVLRDASVLFRGAHASAVVGRSSGARRVLGEYSIKIGLGVGEGQSQLSTGLSGTVTDFEPCESSKTDYTPCQDPKRSNRLPRGGMYHRQRHCPRDDEQLQCLIPPPVGYRFPLPWPQSRDEAWYVNVPYKHLTTAKADQNWVRYNSETERFSFPGGGTMFHDGADKYISDLGQLLPLNDTAATIRTALDTGCGVGSFGAFMLSRNVLTMSVAPRDGHEAQVQFALERGLPAMLGVLAFVRLPYPSRAFDLAHCSRCLIPWVNDGGRLLAEIDRVLRPGGFWVLTGPPINYKKRHVGWSRSVEDLAAEQEKIETAARSLCWEKYKEEGAYCIWRKPMAWDSECLRQKNKSPITSGKLTLCPEGQDPDFSWYNNMTTCISRQPAWAPENPDSEKLTYLAPWPERLWVVPPRVQAGSVAGVTNKIFHADFAEWKSRLEQYKKHLLPLLAAGQPGRESSEVEKVEEESGGIRYRNILDMNAGVGGFAAALYPDSVWVMNVVPVEKVEGEDEGVVEISEERRAEKRLAGELLGTIYERGLLGTFQDWCEAFSTYPRTYDLIHVANLFTRWHMRHKACPVEQVLLEMDRILRPEGAALIQEDEATLRRILPIAKAMRWDARLESFESRGDSLVVAPVRGDVMGGSKAGSGAGKLVLVCVKKYWTAS